MGEAGRTLYLSGLEKSSEGLIFQIELKNLSGEWEPAEGIVIPGGGFEFAAEAHSSWIRHTWG